MTPHLASVRAVRIVPAEAQQVAEEALAEDPGSWLPPGARVDGDAWLVRVYAGRLSRTVRVVVGDVSHTHSAVARELSWTPVIPNGAPIGAVPSFDGSIAVRRGPDGLAGVLTLHGSYIPPMGGAGKVVDRLVMHRVAQHTLARLLDDIHDRIVVTREVV